MTERRIVSLLPSCTEIVCALGAGNRLVGRSHECDYPPEVVRLPVCTATVIDGDAGSAEIDRQVKSKIQQALSLYRVDLERIRTLRPDLILTQDQCAVCGVSLADVQKALGDFGGVPPLVVSLAPSRLADIWDNIQRVADELGIPERGRDLLRSLKGRMVNLIEKTCLLKRRPLMACIEWMDPLMASGNWIPEMVELAGGQNLFGESGKHSPWLEWDVVAGADPEVIMIAPCGFGLRRIRAEMPLLTARPGWGKLRAVRTNRVYLADGSQLFNRPGPRLVDSTEILAEILHPGRFDFGHEGTGWERWRG